MAEQWLAEEADPRVHGTVKEVVSERFAREAPHLTPLPAVRYDTSYREMRLVGWDGYVDIRGNRYSAPDPFRGQPVTVRIRLDGTATIVSDGDPLIEHQLRPAREGWATVPEHHASLWRETLHVERRDLAVYEEVATCSS